MSDSKTAWYLADRLDSPPESAVDDDPGQQEAAGQLPADPGDVVHTVRDLQHEPTKQTALQSWCYQVLVDILLEKLIRGHLGVVLGQLQLVPLGHRHVVRLDTHPLPGEEAARQAAVPVHHPPAVPRVPGVVAARPGQAGGEGGEEVEEGPGDENVVVNTNVQGQHQHPVPDTFTLTINS